MRNSNGPPHVTCCLRNKILGNRTRPAFYQKNLQNLKSSVGFSTGPFKKNNAMRHVTRECLHGKFRIFPSPSSDWTVLLLESLQVAATRSDLFGIRPVQLLQRQLRQLRLWQRHRVSSAKLSQISRGDQWFHVHPTELTAWNCNTEHGTQKEKDRTRIKSKHVLFLCEINIHGRCHNVISLMELNYKGDLDNCTESTLGLQNSHAATTSWTNDVWTKGHQVAIDGYRLFTCDPCRGLQSTQLAEIKLPRLDVTLGRWCMAVVGTTDPGWWCTLGPCDCITWSLPYLNVGWAYPTKCH